MLYFSKSDDKIIKYYVEYDINTILEIRKDIIENCSYIKHFNYMSIDKNINDDKVRNVEIKPYNVKSYDKQGNLVETFHIEYDLYTYSIWVEIIDNLLNGNAEVLNDIFKPIKPKTSLEKINILNQIKEQANYLSNLNNSSNEYTNIIKKLQLLGEEYEILCQKEKTNEKKDINYHKKRLQDSIKFLKVAELSFDEYENILNFFEKEPKILYMLKK